MITKSQMIYGFADEMEKIAAKKDDEPNLNFVERHSKKLLGGTVAAAIGGALLHKKLSARAAAATKQGIHIPKSAMHLGNEAKLEQTRRDFVRKVRQNKHDRKRPALGERNPDQYADDLVNAAFGKNLT